MNIPDNKKRPLPVLPEAHHGTRSDHWAEAPKTKRHKYNSWDITVLPRELVVKIFANLDPCDLLVCTKVSRHWQTVIVTEPTIANLFFDCCRPSVPTLPSLTALPRSPATLIPWQSYYWSIRDWLKGFNEQGRQAVLRLDQGLEPVGQRFPEQLFINVANVLGQPSDFDCQQVLTIKYGMADIKTFFSPDEQHLLVGSWHHPAHIYSLIDQQWQRVATTAPFLVYVITGSFSGNSQHLFLRFAGHRGEIWSLAGRVWQKNIPIGNTELLPSFSAQSEYFAAVGHEFARIYQLVDRQWQLKTTPIDDCRATYVRFHPIDNPVLATSYSKAVSLWRCINGQWQKQAHLPHTHHSSLHFSPDGCRLLAGYIERPGPGHQHPMKTARIWHCVDGAWQLKGVLPLDDSLHIAHFSSDRDALVTVCYNWSTKAWRLSGDTWKEMPPPPPEAVGVDNKCYLSADGLRAVTQRAWGTGKTATVWRCDKDQWHQELRIRHPLIIYRIAFNGLGNHVITASGDKTARIYGYTGGAWRKKATLPHRKGVNSARFSPFGRYVVTSTIDTVHLWTLNHTGNNRDISTLPIELAIKIFANLDACDLLVCTRVSKYWQNLIVTEPTLAHTVFRCCRPSVPVLPSLTALPRSPTTLIPWQSFYGLIRNWLNDFNEQGRQAVRRLDQALEPVAQRFPEQLFVNIASVLAQLRGFTYKRVLSISHPDEVTIVRLSPDEQHLAVVCWHHPIKIYSFIDQQWQDIPTHPQSANVIFARFSPNSQTLVTLAEPDNAEPHSAEIWGLVGNRWQKNTHITRAHPLPSFSAQTQYLVAINDHDEIAKLYELIDGQWRPQTTALDNCLATRARFSPVDNHLLATSYENTVNIWRCSNGQWHPSARLPHRFDQYRLIFSPDGRRLLTYSIDRLEPEPDAQYMYTANIWHAVDGVWQQEAVLPLSAAMNTAHFSSIRGSLVTMENGQGVQLWQVSGNCWKEVPLPKNIGLGTGYLSADGQHLGARLSGWGARSQACVWRFIGDQWHKELVIGHEHRINDICFSCYGNHVITASNDKTAKIYGYIGGKWRKKATLPHADRVISARFSPFSRYVVTETGNNTRTTHLWTVNDKGEESTSESESDFGGYISDTESDAGGSTPDTEGDAGASTPDTEGDGWGSTFETDSDDD